MKMIRMIRVMRTTMKAVVVVRDLVLILLLLLVLTLLVQSEMAFFTAFSNELACRPRLVYQSHSVIVHGRGLFAAVDLPQGRASPTSPEMTMRHELTPAEI